jgi:hypothetical protein
VARYPRPPPGRPPTASDTYPAAGRLSASTEAGGRACTPALASAERRARRRLPALPTVHGLEFAYALYALPPGRLPFRRWRWELWHGPTLVASGWRLARSDAGRALRVRAAEFGCRLFGLPAPAAPTAHGAAADLRPGATERVVIGPITCLLVPRALDRPAALVTG